MSSDAARLVLPALGTAGDPAEQGTALVALSDERLLHLTADGDADAFRVIVERYEPRLHHFVTWYAGEREAADDIVQEILLQIFRSARTFRGASSVRTWLYALARNVCSNHRRDRWPQLGEVSLEDTVIDRMPDVTFDPLALLQRDETIAAVRAAVQEMSRDARLVLTLRDWENLSYAEIAGVLGVPLGTVRSRLHNARARLAAALAARGFAR